MTAVVCALLSAAGFYASLTLGEIWPLAWLAPVPLLWLGFGRAGNWTVFLAAWIAYALGSANLLEAYGRVLPLPVLIVALALPSLAFAASVMGTRLVARRISPLAAVLAFAVMWTSFDYAASLGPDGTATSPAYSQVGAPHLIQGAAVFGLWIVTFLLGFVSAAIALALSERRLAPGLIALAVFAANAGFGAWRIAADPSSPTTRIGLAVDDSKGDASFVARSNVALDAVEVYASAARQLASRGATLIVLPEKLAILDAPWRDEAVKQLQGVSNETGATLVAGFDQRGERRLNAALVFQPRAPEPITYLKRRFVAGLEDDFLPGRQSFVLRDRTGVAICKDMDFPEVLRADSIIGKATLLAVPAWDFDRDGYAHARPAIMRGVEGGYAVARAAKQGLLTLSDAYGSVNAILRSDQGGMVTLIGELKRGPGTTVYVEIGDVFAWICIALALTFVGVSFVPASRDSAA